MSEIIHNQNIGMKTQRKNRARKHSTHIDMTPMVDLMSLLITFFMLTTAFAKPKIMEIVLPDTGGEQSPVPKDRTLNILLSGEDKVYYYIGKPPLTDEENKATLAKLQKTDFSEFGIRKLLLNKNRLLYEKIDSVNAALVKGEISLSQDSVNKIIKALKKKDKVGPIVMIKADNKAKYKNIVDIIDEMAICNVARYAVVEINDFEKLMLESAPY
ncbi:MAG: biopolymer transporter ExbD [Bacteroidales bacterium]